MKGVMFAAPSSGSGKTAVTCAFLQAILRRGLLPAAFKCGPDYIDPMFHREVLGIPSCNLDLFLSSERTVKNLIRRKMAGRDLAVLEGVMGFYDGLGGVTDRASSWHLATVTDVPVILVLRPRGSSLTMAAVIRGICELRENSQVAGFLLNECSPALYRTLAPVLEKETGIKAVGYLPLVEGASFESRHLGLVTAPEVADIRQRVNLLADAMEKGVDVDGILELAEKGTDVVRILDPAKKDAASVQPERNGHVSECGFPVIAVAKDEAFCFYYEENLELLRSMGAQICYFSPLKEEALPPGTSAIYLGGGYPEVYAGRLSENSAMREAVKAAVVSGMPIVAECGGFLYLHQSLEDMDGKAWPMSGALSGSGFRTERLQRFGYAVLTAKEDSLLFRKGEKAPAHEFHYWDSTQNGCGLEAGKPLGNRRWECGVVSEHMYAAFPHLYFPGMPEMARRFVQAAGKMSGRSKEA